MDETLFARNLTWGEVKQRAVSGALALLPVGSTEAHGPHLPLSVDVIIAEAVCLQLARRWVGRGEQAIIFPAVSYGLTDFAASFSGTVSLSAPTTRSLIEEIVLGIASHGFSQIGVVNHHLEPAHFRAVHEGARAASAKGSARVVVCDHRRPPTGPLLGVEFTDGGSHAGAYETSLVMAISPDAVREETRLQLPELAVSLPARIKAGAQSFEECGAADAYLGAPAQATAAEGQRLLEVLVEAAEQALRAAPTPPR